MIRYLELDYQLLQGSFLEIPLFYPKFNDDGDLVDVDLTSATISCSFRKTSTSPVIMDLKTSNSLITITDAAQGKFKLLFPSTLTSAIKETNPVLYKGHVEITVAGETVRTHGLYLFFSPEFT